MKIQCHSGPLRLAALALSAPSVFAQTPQPDPIPPYKTDTRPYLSVDHIQSADTRFATFPIRPMVSVPRKVEGCDKAVRPARLWAVNHHEHLVEAFPSFESINPVLNQGVVTQPDISAHVPMDPVSLAFWDAPGAQRDEVLVVCRGTWGIARLDACDGSLIGFIQLRPSDPLGTVSGAPIGHGRMAEPGDIIVDQVEHRAFVSCTAADTVITIDLETGQLEDRYDNSDPSFRIKTPVFMAEDLANPGQVLVAPLTSGNDTTLDATTNLTIDGLRTGGDVFAVGLPDEDLFRINPASSSPTTVASTGRGTILFAHGVNPSTLDHWQLMTESFNVGVGSDSKSNETEPTLNGRFVSSRITVDGPTTTGVETIMLDEVNHDFPIGGAPNGLPSGTVCGQPYALDFFDNVLNTTEHGNAFIAGLLTDNIVCFDDNRAFVQSWSLPTGSTIPRGVLTGIRRFGLARVAVYCWGSNEILIFDPNPAAGTAALVGRYAMTADTAPDIVKEGRDIFFDGTHSANGAMSCASCHIEVASDLLSWDLSNIPVESKGPMFTQTLVGIERMTPFHWRGERTFADFNGAFNALLGKDATVTSHGLGLSETEFDALEAYVFSLRSPANPTVNRSRVVDRRIQNGNLGFHGAPDGDAHFGQDIYFGAGVWDGNTIFAGNSCVDCHHAPTGNRGNVTNDVAQGTEIVRINIKTAPLVELYRKDMPLYKEGTGAAAISRPMLGFSVAHNGAFLDVFDFVSTVTASDPANPNVPPITGGSGVATPFADSSVTNFVSQWDQGIAPAAHYGFYLDSASDSIAFTELIRYLLPQARPDAAGRRSCDVVVISDGVNGAGKVRYVFDPSLAPTNLYIQAAFVPEAGSGTTAARSVKDFRDGAVNGETHLFVGLPPGLRDKFGADRDLDGIDDLVDTDPSVQEAYAVGSLPAPTYTVTPVVDWAAADKMRILFETDQPTTYRITMIDQDDPMGAPVVKEGVAFSRTHSPIVTGLRGSTLSDGSGASSVQMESAVYDITVEVTNLASGMTPNPSPLSHATGNHFEPSGLTGGASFNERSQHSSVYIETSSLIPNGTLNTPTHYGYDVHVDLSFLRGDISLDSVGDRYVVGRVLTQEMTPVGPMSDQFEPDGPATSLLFSQVEGGLNAGNATMNSLSVGNVEFQDNGVSLPYPNDVPITTPLGYVVSGTTLSDAADGTLNFSFRVQRSIIDSLNTGDALIYSIAAVAFQNPAMGERHRDNIAVAGALSWTDLEMSDTGPGTRPLSQWNFSASGEANSAPAWHK